MIITDIKLQREIDYRYNEPKLLEEAKKYIDGTYDTHYGTESGPQITEAIISSGKGLGFIMGSIMKYAARYGKKEGYNRKDLLKIIHYAVIAMNELDKQNAKEISTSNAVIGYVNNSVLQWTNVYDGSAVTADATQKAKD